MKIIKTYKLFIESKSDKDPYDMFQRGRPDIEDPKNSKNSKSDEDPYDMFQRGRPEIEDPKKKRDEEEREKYRHLESVENGITTEIQQLIKIFKV